MAEMEPVVRSESEESDDDFDFDAIVDKAVEAAGLTGTKAREPMELSLNVGLDASRLYMKPTVRTVNGKVSASFDTTSAPGKYQLRPEDIAVGLAPEAPAARPDGEREVRGVQPRPVDDKKIRNAEQKKLKEDRLDKWFGLKRQQLTPELEQELKAIKMRANVDPKRFYKGNDSKELPKYFCIATEVGGGLRAAGERASGNGKVKGKSFLNSLLQDEKVTEWTSKRQQEVGARGQAAANGGHGKRFGKSTKRGGTWKKTKRA